MTGVELAVIGGTALTLGDAMLVVGTLAGAASAVQAGRQQDKAASYNARVAENDAVAARNQTDFELRALRQKQQAALSTARGAISGRGLTSEGSPLLAQSELAADSELDALALQYSGSVAEARARGQAAVDRLEGGMARAAGYTTAGSSLLSGFSRVKLGAPARKVPLPAADPFTGTGSLY